MRGAAQKWHVNSNRCRSSAIRSPVVICHEFCTRLSCYTVYALELHWRSAWPSSCKKRPLPCRQKAKSPRELSSTETGMGVSRIPANLGAPIEGGNSDP